MKRQIAALLMVACLIALAGCSKNLDNIPSLELVVSESAEWAQEKLAGYTSEQVKEIWGEPDGTLSGFWGDCWD